MPVNISMDIYNKNDESTFYLDVVLTPNKAIYYWGKDDIKNTGELVHNNSLSPLEIMNTIITSLVEREKKET
jgi:hypothetical protein